MKKDFYHGKIKSTLRGYVTFTLVFSTALLAVAAVFFGAFALLYENVEPVARVSLFVLAALSLVAALLWGICVPQLIRVYPKHRAVTRLFLREFVFRGDRPAAHDGQTRIPNGDCWSLLSAYRRDLGEAEGQAAISRLRLSLSDGGYGYYMLLAKWDCVCEQGAPASFDERIVFVPKLSKTAALALGQRLGQRSVTVKQDGACEELCAIPFTDGRGISYEAGDVIGSFSLSGESTLTQGDLEALIAGREAASAVCAEDGGGRPRLKELYEAEPPRGSYFSTGETRYKKIF